jgi:hypothetical protein
MMGLQYQETTAFIGSTSETEARSLGISCRDPQAMQVLFMHLSLNSMAASTCLQEAEWRSLNSFLSMEKKWSLVLNLTKIHFKKSCLESDLPPWLSQKAFKYL